ncbi:MAG: hypothetical protein HZB85_10365 [Deltaproteobacteria bacterium]|nr:hypothetical protein [Deltaproteobacteria bacterium]
MIPVGYMRKRVAAKPDWLEVDGVIDVYSLSNCISPDFSEYINYWKHNGYWLFDSPEAIKELAEDNGIDLSGTTLFYYEAYEYEFDDESNEWTAFSPEPSFVTDVQAPKDKRLEGFDVITFAAHTSPECSPLSCNLLAGTIPANRHCLFVTFEQAKDALEAGLFKNSEPGPYRIFAVYTAEMS